jgi:hypothetical protein
LIECKNSVLVEDIRLMHLPPCDILAITAWEQRYATTLPQAGQQ